jgi:hypothetical protein
MIMNINKIIGLALLVGFLMMPALSHAASPIQLSLFDPIQIVKSDQDVKGFRFNLLYGYNQNVTGVDLGLVNRVGGDFVGFQYGTVNWGEGNGKGLSWGIVNYYAGDYVGWQSAAVNYTGGRFKGFQHGVFNYAAKMRGFQLGIWNQTESLYGLQIGLININSAGDPLNFFPIVLWSFK